MATEEAKYDSVDLTWNHVNCSVESKVEPGTTVQILQDVSGYARAGKMTTIMGPSGAGKTTMVSDFVLTLTWFANAVH